MDATPRDRDARKNAAIARAATIASLSPAVPERYGQNRPCIAGENG